MFKRKPNFSFYAIVVSLIIGAIIGFYQIQPPSVDRDSPIYPVFLQMMENIERWTQSPRPIGSEKLELVRAEIVSEIEGMGFSPIVQSIENINIRLNDIDVDVQNILVKLEHPDANRSVLFMAHYDSVPISPGAGDNMVAVAALLEGLRSLAENSELKNNIYILFTDSEEFGLLGSRGFIAEHLDLLDKIDMVINIDGTGSGGVALFERTPMSYSLVLFYRNAAVKPIGFSLASFIYNMMPMVSDLMPFAEIGLNGFSISAMEGMNTWHTVMDSFENLSEDTAWHYLLNILALVEYVANNNLDELATTQQETVFFPFFPGILVVMSVTVSNIFGIAVCFLAILAFIYKLRQKPFKATLSDICMGLLLVLTALTVVFVASGSYLFSIPLLLFVACLSIKKWRVVDTAFCGLSCTIVMLLWFPVAYLSARILFRV